MFKVGDKVVCIDNSFRKEFLELNRVYKVINVIPYVDNSYGLRLENVHGGSHNYDRFKLALKNNKLNRKLYPNYKVKNGYLIRSDND